MIYPNAIELWYRDHWGNPEEYDFQVPGIGLVVLRDDHPGKCKGFSSVTIDGIAIADDDPRHAKIKEWIISEVNKEPPPNHYAIWSQHGNVRYRCFPKST